MRPDPRSRVACEGSTRFRIREKEQRDGYTVAKVELARGDTVILAENDSNDSETTV